MSDSTKQRMLQNLGSAKKVCFSFDTTGSMSPCIADVRNNLRELVQQMLEDIPGLKISLIAHGDYCDGANCITVLDFTDNVDELVSFINTTPNTSGGDAPECYELALHKARELSWEGEGGAFVLIGDATPHKQGENIGMYRNVARTMSTIVEAKAEVVAYDWKKELQELINQGIQVFALQCLKSEHAADQNYFWESISQEANTPLLILESFRDSANVLGAVAYAATADEETFKKYDRKTRRVLSTDAASMNYSANLDALDAYCSTRNSKETT